MRKKANKLICPSTIVPRLNNFFSKDDKFWIVRISNNPKSNPYRDFEKLQQNIENKCRLIWDKDSRNRISVGDYIGFIVGPVYDADVNIFHIKSELSIDDRDSSWCQYQPYTSGNGNSVPKYREVILLDGPKKVIKWSEWKKKVGYKEIYMPRGTTTAKNPFI